MVFARFAASGASSERVGGARLNSFSFIIGSATVGVGAYAQFKGRRINAAKLWHASAICMSNDC